MYAAVLYKGPAATLGDLREAAETLEDAGRIALRVLGCAHPTTSLIEKNLRRTLADYTAQLYGQGGPPNFSAPIFTAQ